MIRRAPPLVLVVLAGCASRRAQVAPIELERVPIVYGGGGSVRTTFHISPEQWGQLKGLFERSQDAAQERRAAGQAIGLMERIAGEQTITWMDRPLNDGGGQRGQQDCIDESTNTTVYLRLFEQQGLLRWHRVLEPVWRAPHLIDTHRTAVIESTAGGRRYAVDSWFLDNGKPAYVQPLEDWLHRAPFPPQ